MLLIRDKSTLDQEPMSQEVMQLDDDQVYRRPPVSVRRQLRREAGFVCAYPGCGEPYLEYHHFDPPWHVENHHRPEGMVAFCSNHHSRADAWTIEQIKIWKAKSATDYVRAQVEWRREKTLFIAGSNVSIGCTSLLQVYGHDIIWLTSDDQGRALVNFDIRNALGKPAFQMRDSDWIAHPTWDDIEVPPQGRSLQLRSDVSGIKLSLAFTTQVIRKVFEKYTWRDTPEELGAAAKLASIDVDALVCTMTGHIVWPKKVSFTDSKIFFDNFSVSGGFSFNSKVLISIK